MSESSRRAVGSDVPFFAGLLILGGVYVGLIAALLAAQAGYTSPGDFIAALSAEPIRRAIRLSLISSSITTILALWVGVALGYLTTRFTFPGKWLVDALIDIPILLPPMVVGLGLLLLFQTGPAQAFEDHVAEVTYAVPAVILAQFTVCTAFAVRTMSVTFSQIDPRGEQVARTLGCSSGQAFWYVALPEARRGLVTTATVTWARALGEFGPVLLFAGATPMRTVVLPTTIYLEVAGGNTSAAVAVALVMVLAAALVLVIVRLFGVQRT
jgi:molybdate transport system permease protein